MENHGSISVCLSISMTDSWQGAELAGSPSAFICQLIILLTLKNHCFGSGKRGKGWPTFDLLKNPHCRGFSLMSHLESHSRGV